MTVDALRSDRDHRPASDPGDRVDDLVDADVVLEAVGYRLRRAHLLFVDQWTRIFAGLGLPIAPMQGGMMLLIDRNPGVGQGELGRVLGVEGSTMVQAIGRLIELGYVQRYRLPDDRRRWALHLTRRGKQTVGVIEANLRRHEERLLSIFSPRERAQFADLLGRLLHQGSVLADGAAPSEREERSDV